MAAVNDVPQLVDKNGGSYTAIAPKLEPRKFNNFEGSSDTKENRIIDLKLEYKTFRAKSTESISQTYTRYKTLLNELTNDGVNLSKHKINIGFVNSLPEKWLTFSQGLRNANHTQTLGLADIYGRFVYKDNLIQRRYFDTKKALITTPSSTPISTAFFSNNVIQDFQENYDDEVDERTSFQPKFTPKLIHCSINSNNQADQKFQKDYKAEYKKMKAKLALLEASSSSSQNPKTFQPKNKALADDDLTVEKCHARNDEWVDITMRKVNTLLSMDEDADWQNYLKYINIDLKFVEEQRLNLLSKYKKMIFELNKCRDELLILKQAKLDAVTFQIQNTKLTKLNHALQEQLKEEKKINEKWLTISKKVIEQLMAQSGLDLKMAELLASAAIFVKMGVLQIGISAMVIENKVKTLTITTFLFLAIKVLRATAFPEQTMSSPNHSTSDIEDAFSSMNILNYTLISSDYFPASSGSSSFNSSENS
ncbi:hypothetical protein Tco_1090707 [Tanacetum coccineum]|uniref:Uncharacterized protein n=1 Tax=Tanacetum coccineum TaxID=301880 RepID=A0ABQ5I669_9ASTR